MKRNTEVQLMKDIIARALADEAGLERWALVRVRTSDEVSIALRDFPEDGHAINWQVVTRGVWYIRGGQQMDLPAGVMPSMVDQLARALSDLDAELMDPATASAVIQVGLFRQVLYR